MDRLTTMTTFLKVVQYANFTSAAEAIGISRTLVSRQIADLESHLGVALLHRTTRSVTVTEAGLRYSELCQRVLADIRNGEHQIATGTNAVDGDIAVLCPIWISSCGIAQAMAEFARDHPGVVIRLHVEEPSPNLLQGYDLCIQDSGRNARKIGAIDHVLAASPTYLERAGTPRSVADLADHAGLARTTDAPWRFANGERITVPVRFSSNSMVALRAAALAGLGVAVLPKGLAGPILEQGLLSEVLPDLPLAQRPLYVVTPPGSDAPGKTRALIAFLADGLRDRRFAVVP